ncbi:MAG TPA: FecR domain-containing protein [Pyrinomonadaceae bacterium]|nr:FecR domain-containing protein [Pyrinomonadaceae bacterium]
MKEPLEEQHQYRKFYIEWWNIRKSTIYTIALVIVLSVVSGGLYIAATRFSWFSGPVEADTTANAARIISFEGDVRVTKASTRETIIVTRVIYVAAGDTIQTQADGRATLQMVDGSVYTVKPNSTVVVRDNSSLFGNKNVRVSLDDGQLNVKTQQQGDNTQNVVEVAESENKLMPETDASFNADAQTNGGEIRITRGGVETTLDGETTVIHENEFASVNNGQISSREKLLDPPKQTSPANLTQIIDSTGTGGTIELTWQGNSATAYYLQVSRSPYFSSDSILVDRSQMTTNNFRLGGLSPGTYYWRVRSTAKSGQTTDWNEPWKFLVIRNEGGRSIEVADWHAENIGGNVYLITGRTQPGLSVRTQGREPIYAGSDGSFRLQVSTPAAVTAIEVSDDRGNRAGFVLSLQTAKVMRKY